MTILQQIIAVAAVVLGTMAKRFLPFLMLPVPQSSALSIGAGTVFYAFGVNMVLLKQKTNEKDGSMEHKRQLFAVLSSTTIG